MKTSEGRGGQPFLSNVEPLKYRYRIGLETLVVYTVNQWVLYFELIYSKYQLTRKYLAWGVKLQR